MRQLQSLLLSYQWIYQFKRPWKCIQRRACIKNPYWYEAHDEVPLVWGYLVWSALSTNDAHLPQQPGMHVKPCNEKISKNTIKLYQDLFDREISQKIQQKQVYDDFSSLQRTWKLPSLRIVDLSKPATIMCLFEYSAGNNLNRIWSYNV